MMDDKTKARWTIVCESGNQKLVADIDPDDKGQIDRVIADIKLLCEERQ